MFEALGYTMEPDVDPVDALIGPVVAWNDNKDTTVDDVIELLDKLASK